MSRMFPDPGPSPLPQTPKLRSVLAGRDVATFDLSGPASEKNRVSTSFRLLTLGSFVLGLAALGVAAYLVWSGRTYQYPGEIWDLIQVNGWAYLVAFVGLSWFLMNRNPPTGLTVSTKGLELRLHSGRTAALTWDEVDGTLRLFAGGEENSMIRHGAYELQSTHWKDFVGGFFFFPPRIPRTYLTRDAFDATLEGAARAGLTVTQLGYRYAFDRRNPMNF